MSVLVAEDESGPVAIAVTEALEPSAAILLTYFATRADRRGQGLGSTLFQAMVTAVRERTPTPLLALHVEESLVRTEPGGVTALPGPGLVADAITSIRVSQHQRVTPPRHDCARRPRCQL